MEAGSLQSSRMREACRHVAQLHLSERLAPHVGYHGQVLSFRDDTHDAVFRPTKAPQSGKCATDQGSKFKCKCIESVPCAFERHLLHSLIQALLTP